LPKRAASSCSVLANACGSGRLRSIVVIRK